MTETSEFETGGIVSADPVIVGEHVMGTIILNKIVAEIEAAVPQPSTREQMYAALHDDSTPTPVKRFLREQLYGEARGRREDRSRSIRNLRVNIRTNVLAEAKDDFGKVLDYKMGHLTSAKPKKPAGMSVKQWKACKRAVRQEVKARHAAEHV
jgi:hypothetical protein